MSYANANIEVKGYTGFSTDYSSTTMPTLAQVGDIISQVEGEVNSILLGLSLTVPITNTNLVAYVRKYSGMGSAGLTLQRYGKSDADFRLADWFYSKYETWIEKLLTDKTVQNNFKMLDGNITGYYVSSNATDGSHTGADVSGPIINYELDI